MSKEKCIEALYEFCAEFPRCDECPIGAVPNLRRQCIESEFENMSYEQLSFFADYLKLEIPEGEPDPVNHASHYNDGAIECIDALEASMTPIEYAGFLKGQVFKYIWRYRLKGKPVEDLKKARYYLDRLIQITEKEAAV